MLTFASNLEAARSQMAFTLGFHIILASDGAERDVPAGGLEHSVPAAPMTRNRTLSESTARAPVAWRASPSPSAIPKYAAAGIVVTEIATPTPALARVSIASVPATPAKSATTIVSSLTSAMPRRTVSWMVGARRQEVELVLKQREQSGADPRDGKPRDERQGRAQGELEVAADHADGYRRDRQGVRTDRHRADDQYRIAIDDAIAPDDPGNGHEREVL